MSGVNERSSMGENLSAVRGMGIVLPDGPMLVLGHVCAVLQNVHTGKKTVIEGDNLITDAGDRHYAERVDDSHNGPVSFTNAFDIFELGTGHTGVAAKGDDRSDITGFVASSQKVFDATYPLHNDPDGDNSGSGVDIVSYRVSYTTGEANSAGIDHLIVTNVTPGASEPIMTHAEFGAAFEKTASDTLKVFLNHQMNGV